MGARFDCGAMAKLGLALVDDDGKDRSRPPESYSGNQVSVEDE